MTGPRRGRFITFEGGEGGGKSTQIKRLAAWLADAGIAVTTTREPGGTEGAERIRALLVAGDVAPLTVDVAVTLLAPTRI